jgi:hypothetical protein
MVPELFAPPISTVGDQPGLWLLARIGTTLWSSILTGGMLLVALNLVRGVAVGPKCFLEGARYWFRIACLELLVSIPYLVATLMKPTISLQFYGRSIVVLIVVCVALCSLLVLVRTVIAAVLVVDRDVTVRYALLESWRATGIQTGRIVIFCGCLVVPTIVWAVGWKRVPVIQQIGRAMIRPLFLFIWIRLYESVGGRALVAKTVI